MSKIFSPLAKLRMPAPARSACATDPTGQRVCTFSSCRIAKCGTALARRSDNNEGGRQWLVSLLSTVLIVNGVGHCDTDSSQDVSSSSSPTDGPRAIRQHEVLLSWLCRKPRPWSISGDVKIRGLGSQELVPPLCGSSLGAVVLMAEELREGKWLPSFHLWISRMCLPEANRLHPGDMPVGGLGEEPQEATGGNSTTCCARARASASTPALLRESMVCASVPCSAPGALPVGNLGNGDALAECCLECGIAVQTSR
mmetsp:Transcript_121354/g.259096  ORF Transcript_121354/g.259096 Transcript_121354/m.259096 type:complete len:255 (-) Transcript_121354:67-831(-)